MEFLNSTELNSRDLIFYVLEKKEFYMYFIPLCLITVFVHILTLSNSDRSITYMDSPEPWQINFQDPATPIAQGIQDLHHDIFFFMLFVLTFVVWMLARTLWHFHASKNPIPAKIIHGTAIEVAWTVTPSLILMIIAIPSFALLYSMDEVNSTMNCAGFARASCRWQTRSGSVALSFR